MNLWRAMDYAKALTISMEFLQMATLKSTIHLVTLSANTPNNHPLSLRGYQELVHPHHCEKNNACIYTTCTKQWSEGAADQIDHMHPEAFCERR